MFQWVKPKETNDSLNLIFFFLTKSLLEMSSLLCLSAYLLVILIENEPRTLFEPGKY